MSYYLCQPAALLYTAGMAKSNRHSSGRPYAYGHYWRGHSNFIIIVTIPYQKVPWLTMVNQYGQPWFDRGIFGRVIIEKETKT